ncbi:MAG: four helix bundle protein [bacterium]
MNEKLDDFRQLVVWQKSHHLVIRIYEITKNFPTEAKYGLLRQMCPAAVSIPANSAEGLRNKA